MSSQKDRAELAQHAHTDQRGIARALKNCLRAGIDRLERRNQVPTASKLLPSVADLLGLPGSLVNIVRDSVVDALPPTADMHRWSHDLVDLNAVLADRDAHKSLESAIIDAFLQGAVDTVRGPIEDALPIRSETSSADLGLRRRAAHSNRHKVRGFDGLLVSIRIPD